MQSKLSKSDEWETPKELYDHLCMKYKLNPTLDVACDEFNKKCPETLDGLNAVDPHRQWLTIIAEPVDVWCNPPHSKSEEFVKKAYEQWTIHNINIMMILPANSLCTNYAEKWIAPYAEYHPINRRYCAFLHQGEKKDKSRNGYFVVIWRKV